MTSQNKAPALTSPDAGRGRTLKRFAAGLGTRLAGVSMIWLGDGRTGLPGKAMVVAGVALSVAGIGVLKYLMMGGLKAKRRRTPVR